MSGEQEDGNVTDVRQRLAEVLDMSAKAAHRNLEMVEELRPQAAQLSERARALAHAPEAEFRTQALALATQAEDFAARSGARFSDVIETQSWQDLSGQRVKKVVSFIDKVEASLLELVHLTGSLAGGSAKAATAPSSVERAHHPGRSRPAAGRVRLLKPRAAS